MTRRGILLLLGTALCAAARINAAPPVNAVSAGPVTLLINERHAVVREPFTVTIPETSTVVRLPLFPVEADPSSLAIIDRRRELQLLEWYLPPRANSGALKASNAGSQVKVELKPAPTVATAGVDMSLRVLELGDKKFDVVYVVTGLTWKVTYDVLLRGDLRDISSPMSMDVEGWVEISNATQRTFRDAHIVLVGSDTLGITQDSKPPGILDLDENTPLADLWRFQPGELDTSHFYAMDNRVNLPAGETMLVSLVSVTRKPVDRILVLRAEEIPTDTQSRFAMPSQIIRFENAADYGGNRAVPPGRALIHLGNQRSSLYQLAWFKHTPAQGEISLDMGKLPGIRARRIDRGRRELSGGYLEHVFELRLENTFKKPVLLIVDEQPPLTLAWSPLRSNQPYEQLDRRLIFKPTLAANSELVIQYTLRVEIPKN